MTVNNSTKIIDRFYKEEILEIYEYFIPKQNEYEQIQQERYQNYIAGKEIKPEEKTYFETMEILNKIGLNIFDKKTDLYMDLILAIYESNSDVNNYKHLKTEKSELYFNVARITNDVGIETYHELIESLFKNIELKNNDYIKETFPEEEIEEIKNPYDLAFIIAINLKHNIYKGIQKIKR